MIAASRPSSAPPSPPLGAERVGERWGPKGADQSRVSYQPGKALTLRGGRIPESA
jgi:hypothetical protein